MLVTLKGVGGEVRASNDGMKGEVMRKAGGVKGERDEGLGAK